MTESWPSANERFSLAKSFQLNKKSWKDVGLQQLSTKVSKIPLCSYKPLLLGTIFSSWKYRAVIFDLLNSTIENNETHHIVAWKVLNLPRYFVTPLFRLFLCRKLVQIPQKEFTQYVKSTLWLYFYFILQSSGWSEVSVNPFWYLKIIL